MVEKTSSTFIYHLGTLLVLCALATCGTSEQYVVGWLGQDLRLPCDFTAQSDVLALYWTNSNKTVKVSFFIQQRRSFDDRFTLNEDFSLVISDLRVSDEGRYTCRVELDSGESLINHTTVTIYALAPVPHIEQCVSKMVTKEHSSCTVETSNTHPFNLECLVTGFRPNVTLEWTSSGIVKQPIGESTQWTLPNGTSGREVTISVTAKPYEIQRYTCTVRGEATNGTDRSATVTVAALATTAKGVPTWKKIVGGVGGALCFSIFFLCSVICVVRLCQDDLKALRTEIEKYTFKVPGKEDVRATANIGLFGEMGAGKSSFMNSLEFSLKGTQSQPTGDRGDNQGGHSIIRGCLNLTDHISLYDNRGMKDFSLSYVNRYMKEISDEKEEPSQFSRFLDEEIHCPVFVYRYSDSGKEAAVEFLEEFASRLRGYNGYLPMVVVTHADSLSEETNSDLKEDFSGKCKEVWFFENYINSVEIKAQSIRFLKFLKAALHQCEVSVVNTERRRKLKKPRKTWWQWLTGQ